MAPDALPDDLASIWERVREELRGQLPAATFQLWIEPLEAVSAQGNTLHLAASQTTRTWVERRYLASVEAALRATGSGLERVVFVAEGRRASQAASAESSTGAVESLPLDPRHTFERFVIGGGNRLAHSAALAVAEMPGEAYNPLFLHGPPGLGKTHLLGAVADYLSRVRPELTVHYTTADRFTADFVGGLRKDGPERFKQRYRELDALLIDDVQALEGKEATQEEFVHTFNSLHAAGKQIVLSSDRPPEAIARVAERLRDRFGWGLCAELALPRPPYADGASVANDGRGQSGGWRPGEPEGDRRPGARQRPPPPGSDDARGGLLLHAQRTRDAVAGAARARFAARR